MYPEKDFPGLQQTPSRWGVSSIHQRSLLGIGDQSEMRGGIAGVNCIAEFSQLLQEFGRLQIQICILFHRFAAYRLRCNSPDFFCSSSKVTAERWAILSNFDCRMAGPPLL